MYARPSNDIIHLTYNLIPIKHFTNSHTKTMLDTNSIGYDDSQSFSTPIKRDHGATS